MKLCGQTGKTTPIMRTDVRETDVSRRDGNPIEGPENHKHHPSNITTLQEFKGGLQSFPP